MSDLDNVAKKWGDFAEKRKKLEFQRMFALDHPVVQEYVYNNYLDGHCPFGYVRAINLRACEDSIPAQWARRTIARLGCSCLMRLFMVIPWRIGGCISCLSGLKRLPWGEGRDRASLKMFDSRRRLNWLWRCWTEPTREAICCFSGSAGTTPTGMLMSFGSTLQAWEMVLF